MDSITHIVLGGCLGQVTLGKQAGRKAVLWGAIADTVPDLDIFLGPLVHPVQSLLTHRGFTHSILFAAVFPLILGNFLARIYRKDEIPREFIPRESIPWWRWAILIGLGTFSHIFIDSLTNYGTGLFEPFCNHRFSYTTIFIADPLFTLPMLLAFIILLFKNVSLPFKNKVARYALILSGIYLSWTIYNRSFFENHFENQLTNQQIPFSGQSLTPAPLNNILWSTLAKSDSGYYQGHYSLLDDSARVNFNYIPAHKELAASFIDNKEYQLLERFSKGYSCISILEDGLPYFHDLRFGTTKGWRPSIGDFTFNYPLQIDSTDNKMLIKSSPWNMARFEGLGDLWERVKGK
ncbi:MAG: metal-dependent hydrolase [Saprospiraceae bacterium]|nr:metal-dependent hydrolase [Saprospiraceae bacterium]